MPIFSIYVEFMYYAQLLEIILKELKDKVKKRKFESPKVLGASVFLARALWLPSTHCASRLGVALCRRSLRGSCHRPKSPRRVT